MDLSAGPEAFAPHLLEACPELKDRVVVINAASKNYAMPGWRVGWALSQEKIIQAMNAFQSQTVSCSPTIAQMAMAQTFSSCESDLKKTHQALCEKREKIMQALGSVKGIRFQKPEGAFYLWLDVRLLFSKTYKGRKIESSMDVFHILSQDYALFTVAGEEFGRGGFLRLHFAVEDLKIDETVKRLDSFVSELS